MSFPKDHRTRPRQNRRHVAVAIACFVILTLLLYVALYHR
jgi:hypothetical protein